MAMKLICCQKPGTTTHRGFSLVELITIMVIMGILAAVAAPRFFARNAFDSRGFYDQTLSTLRHAQKIAIAQRRLVCVAFTVNTITLTIDSNTPADGACNAAPAGNLTSPDGVTPYVVVSAQSQFANPLNGAIPFTPAAFSFNALGGASAAQNITVSGYATAITVDAVTGYVR